MIELTIQADRAPRAGGPRVVTDPTKLASWQTNTVSVVPEDDGPLGQEMRLREVHTVLVEAPIAVRRRRHDAREGGDETAWHARWDPAQGATTHLLRSHSDFILPRTQTGAALTYG